MTHKSTGIYKGTEMNASTGIPTGVFENYWAAVQNTKLRNTTLTDAREACLYSNDLDIDTLFKTLSHQDWKGRKRQDKNVKEYGANWIWREEQATEPNKNGDPEVLLERAIARTDHKIWSYQMSTASGINDESGKCAIDLVRWNGQDSFAFIELKIDANNPVYAAFEILGYALAYLHARTADWPSDNLGRHNVMSAKQIELAVVGKENWYETFSKSWRDDLAPLANQIQRKINELTSSTLRIEKIGSVTFDFRFKSYREESREKQVEEITALWSQAQVA